MSTEGTKYINKEIKNAFKGVKQLKSLIEHTNDERKSLLISLEEAKKKKEVRRARWPCACFDRPCGRAGTERSWPLLRCPAGLPH